MERTILLRNIVLAAAVFVLSAVVGTTAPPAVSAGMQQELKEVLGPLMSAGPLTLLVAIFLNNALKSLGAIVLGVLAGLPPLLFMGLNGFILGALVVAVQPARGLAAVVASLAPHGVIEIPMILLAAALGLSVGWESVKRLTGRRSEIVPRLSYGLRLYVKVILPGLGAAALIEVFITPLILSLVLGK